VTSFRLSGDAMGLIGRLASRHSASKARVVEMAVRTMARKEGMGKRIRLSLDYDGQSRGADEVHEYLTRAEKEQLVTDYIHFHADRIAEMAGVADLSEVDDPERFVDVTEEG
jgi:hypothetical protein